MLHLWLRMLHLLRSITNMQETSESSCYGKCRNAHPNYQSHTESQVVIVLHM